MRSTGRTLQALVAVPINGVFIIPHAHLYGYCKGLIGKHNLHDKIKFVSMESDWRSQIRGYRRSQVQVDHTVWELCSSRTRQDLVAELELMRP